MAREIVLDTETTGLDPKTGHRLIEIACIELEDYLPTGRHFHRYCHPDRTIDPDAERVHGISLASLADKPRFHEPQVWEEMVAFIGEADLIAHNAPFDRGFLNAELGRVNHPRNGGSTPCRWRRSAFRACIIPSTRCANASRFPSAIGRSTAP